MVLCSIVLLIDTGPLLVIPAAPVPTNSSARLSLQGNIQMPTGAHRLCTRHEDDRLRIVNDHSRTFQPIPRRKRGEEEYGSGVHPPYLVEVHTICCVRLRLVDRFCLELLGFFKDGVAEGVEGFARPSNLSK